MEVKITCTKCGKDVSDINYPRLVSDHECVPQSKEETICEKCGYLTVLGCCKCEVPQSTDSGWETQLKTLSKDHSFSISQEDRVKFFIVGLLSTELERVRKEADTDTQSYRLSLRA